jgi:hypothetical protein
MQSHNASFMPSRSVASMALDCAASSCLPQYLHRRGVRTQLVRIGSTGTWATLLVARGMLVRVVLWTDSSIR